MQRYWPEFRAPATVRHVLSHQAGVVVLDEPAPTEVLLRLGRAVRDARPPGAAWPPGTAHGESALFYGHLVGSSCGVWTGARSGASSGGGLEPLGLDLRSASRREERSRAVELTGLDEEFAARTSSGSRRSIPRAIGNPPGARDATVVNSAAWRETEVPSINGHGTARGAAGLYAALLQGELLSAELLAEATRAQCSGPDHVFGEDNASRGLGFAVDEDGFGMGGTGGSVAAASTVGGYAFAFVTGSMGGHASPRRSRTSSGRASGCRPPRGLSTATSCVRAAEQQSMRHRCI